MTNTIIMMGLLSYWPSIVSHVVSDDPVLAHVTTDFGVDFLGSENFDPADVDLRSDDSLTKYVGPEVGLLNARYVPDLIPLPYSDNLVFSKASFLLSPQTVVAVVLMSQALKHDTGESLALISSYRSYDYQAILLRNGNPEWIAKPGHSEHQLGLTIDVIGLSNATLTSDTKASRIYQWMRANAHIFGFHESYQYGKDIDGYHEEKWHRRYVGVDLATYLWEKEISLTQFYYAHLMAGLSSHSETSYEEFFSHRFGEDLIVPQHNHGAQLIPLPIQDSEQAPPEISHYEIYENFYK